MLALELFLECVVLSFFAFGGATALLPELHRVVVDNHQWLDSATFTHVYAIGQAAPGPNVLVVALIGWEVAGFAGAVAATLGLCLPMSVLIYLLMDHWQKLSGQRWQRAVQTGVSPLAVGLVISAATLIGVAAGFRPGGWALVLAVVFLNLRYKKLHPLWLIGLGAVVGLLGLV